jgi:hypothetical protein
MDWGELNMTYLKGFYRFLVTVQTRQFGVFTEPVWARTLDAAIASVERKWGKNSVVR